MEELNNLVEREWKGYILDETHRREIVPPVTAATPKIEEVDEKDLPELEEATCCCRVDVGKCPISYEFEMGFSPVGLPPKNDTFGNDKDDYVAIAHRIAKGEHGVAFPSDADSLLHTIAAEARKGKFSMVIIVPDLADYVKFKCWGFKPMFKNDGVSIRIKW